MSATSAAPIRRGTKAGWLFFESSSRSSMIFFRKPVSTFRDHALSRDTGTQESVDLRRCQRPVIVEVGDDGLHERFRERDSAFLVAQVVIEDRERQLLRAFTFVGPFKAVFGEAFDLVVLVERAAVDRHDQ